MPDFSMVLAVMTCAVVRFFRLPTEIIAFSEKIAEIIYPQEEPKQLLLAAEEKARYMRIKNQRQGKMNF